jgi:hypothetical protein
MEQWLIRTEKNWIKGPYSKEQVCKMITDGTLGVQDEVCPANGYWILLHERKEIFEHLGVEVPRAAGVEDEVTESDIDTTLEESTVNGENSDSIAAASHSVSDTSSSTTFITRSGPSVQTPLVRGESAPEEVSESAPNQRWLSFILFGIGLLLIIALRAFKH